MEDYSMAGNDEDAYDDVDLYDDLLVENEVENQEQLAQTQKEYESLKSEQLLNKEKIVQLETQNQVLSRQNNILKKNISVLYKTAKLEILRKNELLNDLQRRYDQLVFRRLNGSITTSHNVSSDGLSKVNNVGELGDTSRKTITKFKYNNEFTTVTSSQQPPADQDSSEKNSKIDNGQKLEVVKSREVPVYKVKSTCTEIGRDSLPVKLNQVLQSEKHGKRINGNISADAVHILNMVGIQKKAQTVKNMSKLDKSTTDSNYENRRVSNDNGLNRCENVKHVNTDKQERKGKNDLSNKSDRHAKKVCIDRESEKRSSCRSEQSNRSEYSMKCTDNYYHRKHRHLSPKRRNSSDSKHGSLSRGNDRSSRNVSDKR
ncbi:hypothetical protein CHUAL_013241 [Chamberlinius hualienensis]